MKECMQHSIESHNFDEAKQKIQTFSNDLPSAPNLKKVEEDVGPFGWMDHDVSGKEFNELVSNLQESTISIYDWIKKVIQEFGEIYRAFESLDKDYIQGILISLKAAEKASNQALEISKRLDVAQNDLKSTINTLVIVVKKLAEFKKSVEDAKLIKELANSDDVEQLRKTLDESKKIVDEIERCRQENRKQRILSIWAIVIGVIALSVSVFQMVNG